MTPYVVHEYGWAEGAAIRTRAGQLVIDGIRPIKLAYRVVAALNHAYALGHRAGAAMILLDPPR